MWSDGSSNFSVADCYSKILSWRRSIFDPGVLNFNWKYVWLPTVPSKVNFLMWVLIRNRLLSHEGLQLRGFSLASKCFFCGINSESYDHLFANCNWIRKVWDYFSVECCTSLNKVNFKERLLDWKPRSVTSQGAILKGLVPHVFVWAVWNERNHRCFDEVVSSQEQLVVEIKQLVWNWCLDRDCCRDLRFEHVVFNWYSL